MQKHLLVALASIFIFNFSKAQLVITPQSNALALVQKLVGQGVTVSNITITADPRSVGFFKNISGTSIGLDSGIVLTNGKAKSSGTEFGLDGDGITTACGAGTFPTSGSGAFATLDLLTPGDVDLDLLVQDPTLDATILEFDFVPTGDSIKFRYVFSSEEYPEFPCTGVNDVFAFFIQGPGYPVKTNIALVPNTAASVTIDNINNIPACGLYPQFYVNNFTNKFFTHNGHTVVFTAKALVQPCQTYHLKLAIADVGDDIYDSGVFLEAKSLTSNSTTVSNITPLDATGTNYLAEGCVAGKIRIQRQVSTTLPQNVTVQYTGTATNGIDVALLPITVTIPANQTTIDIDITAIQDNILEGIENLLISIYSSCNSTIPLSTATLQIRDYEPLQVSPGKHPDTAFVCRNGSQLLAATIGYTSYTWSTNPVITLNNANIRTPLAIPISSISKYICTASIGTCMARDSLNLKWKDISVLSKTNITCANGNTGQIKVEAGTVQEWIRPLQFSINGNPYQPDSTFNNLTQGNYTIKILDASGCLDSISTSLTDLFAAISFTTQKVNPSCLGGNNGSFTITAFGGNPPYSYSLDNNPYQTSNIVPSGTGIHTLNVKDVNGCVKSKLDSLSFINTITLITTTPTPFCESLNKTLVVQSNATSFEWIPMQGLSNANIINPIAAPSVTTKYYVKAKFGICSSIDSILVTILPAPIAYAGSPINACFNKDAQLNASGGLQYFWSPATFLSNINIKDPLIIKPNKNVTYFLNVTDANGCKSLQASQVNFTVTPLVKIFAGNDTIVAINQPFQHNVIELSNAGVISYEWTNPYNLNFTNIFNPIAILDRDYEYYVTGKTINDCEGRGTIKIKAYNGPTIYVPNTFTPNGDNLNDIFKPICVGIKTLTYFKVFNRFGEIVFETSIVNKGWNGNYKTVPQGTATFVWIAEAVDYLGKKIQKKGTFILLR